MIVRHVQQVEFAGETRTLDLRGVKKVNKNKLKYLADIILFISMFGLAGTGIIMAFCTQSGPRVEESLKYFLKLHRHQWGTIHFYFSIILVIFVIIHLILEWDWIKLQTQKILKSNWNLVTLVFLSIFILFLGWSFTSKNYDKFSGHGAIYEMGTPGVEFLQQKWGQASDVGLKFEINGRLTFKDIEKQTGISAKMIVEQLNLPENIDNDERLGSLKKTYHFTIQDVREVVQGLLKEKNNKNHE